MFPIEMYRSIDDAAQIIKNCRSNYPPAHAAAKEELIEEKLIKAQHMAAASKQAASASTSPAVQTKYRAQFPEQNALESIAMPGHGQQQDTLKKRSFDDFSVASLWASGIPEAFNLDKSEFGILQDADLEVLPVENQIDLSTIGDDVGTPVVSASIPMSTSMDALAAAGVYGIQYPQLDSELMPQTFVMMPVQGGTMVNCDLSPQSKRRRLSIASGHPECAPATGLMAETFSSIPMSQPMTTSSMGTEWRPLVEGTASPGAYVSASPPPRRRGLAAKDNADTTTAQLLSRSSSSSPTELSRRPSQGSEASVALTDECEEIEPLQGESPAQTLARANHVIRDLKAALEKARACALELQMRSDTLSSPPQSPQAEDLQLRVASKIEDVWYADRPFPAFNVEICDANTSQVLTRVHGWQLKVTLVDGYGRDAMDALGGQSASHGFKYTLTGGRATITGLRFTAVSSKRGGHFQLAVSVVSPDDAKSVVETCYASRVQVLSYRLYHSPKVALDRLSPSDSLSKVRGIGSLYAKRFANMGIHTVGELAEVDVQSMDDTTQKTILEALRRDRGAMTLAKLENYVLQARTILGRHTGDDDDAVCL